jgi:hypothetical protein
VKGAGKDCRDLAENGGAPLDRCAEADYMRRMKTLIASAFLFAGAFGCASTTLYKRPDAPKVDLAADKFLIMPVDIHGLPGDNMAQGAALFGGFVGAFKENGVPLQPVKPAFEAVGLGNVSWELAEGMHHLVSFHESYDFSQDGGFHGGDSKLPLLMEGTAKLVEIAAEQLKLDFKPKYVVVCHIDSASSSIPKTIGYRVIGGLYNVEASRIDQVIWYEKTTADDPAAILAEMGTLGSELHGKLFPQEQ